MKWAPALGALAALAISAQAKADDPEVAARYTPGMQRCMDAPGGDTTQGMVECYAAERERQDARLNSIYQSVIRRLTPSQAAALRQSERAWIAYRDANCAAKLDVLEWGTMSRLTAADCLVSMTIQRTIELENWPPEGEDRD
ncbi:MAG: lysozyme inhibitor LprI family protein [Caulobacteraceae bacterium]